MKKYALKMTVAAALAAITGVAGLQAQTIKVDPDLPSYSSTSGVSGTLNSVGSDTLNNLMTFWSEGFKKMYPNVNFQVEGKGSSTAPPALIKGTSQLGPMSRKMKYEEIDEFEKKFGYKPTMIAVAIDALAVFVNKDNPIKSLNMQQLDSIFSSTRKRGGKDATKWGDVGLTGDWADKPISLYGRNSASGTYGFFKEHVLKKGDYKGSVKEQPGSASVVQSIEKELGAIGYSGIGYKTSGVKAIAVADKAGPVEPTQKNTETFKYPIARYLYIYVNRDPVKGMDPAVREFLKYVVSRQGQEVVIKDGFFPLSVAKSREMIALLK